MSEIFRREWAMPSPDTFSIKPIKELLDRYLNGLASVVDPFARNSKRATVTNDLNPETSAMWHMDSRLFLGMLASDGTIFDAALFDPPYSPRQISECYQSVGRKPTMKDTQSACLYADIRLGIDKVLKPGGIVISFGWNSTGMGKQYERIETLLVCHGGAHNDTICVVQKKPETNDETL